MCVYHKKTGISKLESRWTLSRHQMLLHLDRGLASLQNTASWRTFVLNPVTHRYMCGHLRARSFSVHRHSPATYHLLPRADEASANSGLSQSLFQAIDWMKN
nr:uncharacterized protein LOC105483976 isoform X2 [Macaca nemestrina]